MNKETRTIVYDDELQIEAYSLNGYVRAFPNHFHEYYVFGKLILAHIGNYAFEDPAAMFVISAQYEFQQKPHSNALKASIEHFHLYNYQSELSYIPPS